MLQKHMQLSHVGITTVTIAIVAIDTLPLSRVLNSSPEWKYCLVLHCVALQCIVLASIAQF